MHPTSTKGKITVNRTILRALGATKVGLALLLASILAVIMGANPAAAATTPASIVADITAAAGPSNGTTFDPTVSLFHFDTGKTRAVVANGLTVWPNVTDGVSYAARTISGGTQHFVDIAGPKATTKFSGNVAAGYTAIQGPNNHVLLVNNSTRAATAVPTPWAYDATGKAVATHYEIMNGGAKFVQVVDHNVSGVTYPVVADPVFQWQWGNANYLLNKAETNNLAFGSVLVGLVALKYLPTPWTKFVAGVGTAWQGFAAWVQGRGSCLAFTVTAWGAYPWFYSGWPCV